MRPVKGNELWNQESQFIVFYDVRDGLPVITFDNPWEIIDYKGWARNKSNYDIVYSELVRALKSDDHYTRMLGRHMTVYLIDYDEENES
jgi:hypothetical protein